MRNGTLSAIKIGTCYFFEYDKVLPQLSTPVNVVEEVALPDDV